MEKAGESTVLGDFNQQLQGLPTTNPKTILDTYAHLLPTSDAAAAEVIASALVDKPLTEAAANHGVEPNLAP